MMKLMLEINIKLSVMFDVWYVMCEMWYVMCDVVRII